MTGHVYFLENEAGHIKIGFSRNLPMRMQTLRLASSSNLKLLASVAGNRKAERFFQNKVKDHKKRGEWFLPEPPVKQLISDVIKYGDQLLPDDYKPDEDEKQHLRNIQAGICELCKEYVNGIVGGMGIDETKDEALKRVAKATKLPVRTVKSIWYKESNSISAIAFLSLRRAFVEKYLGNSQKFYEIDIAVLFDAARRLRGDDAGPAG